MEGDFKRPPSHRGLEATDLRPAPSHPAVQPAPHYAPPQQSAYQPETIPKAEPPATTAELIARHERENKPKAGIRRNLILAAAGILIVAVAAILLIRHPTKAPAGPFPAAISKTQITIPVYYPSNLPTRFKVSGYKVVKQDVLNYVVTSKDNYNYYVNIQAVPAGYDFSAFNKRFTNPTTYKTAIGTATAGLMNNSLICSIQAGKSWVLINTTAVKTTADMQTIAESLKPASL